MANLTSEQVKQLADDLLHMTNAVGDYRYENFDKLTEDENSELKELHNQLLGQTTELYTKSALLVMNDVDESLNAIRTITEKTQNLYKNLGVVQKAIDWAARILGMASAIISLDTDNIASSIKNLLT
ncbi:MAG: hypothetical protein CML04_08600 [Pseudozobellia sp.]|nr:hypothetical protein [Pseudozobellia sp.]MBG48697.1 hypothetical protein [Pseudozobellia sp.]|tara:strand:- start:2370 stop:2750 length:381 start_codon:yes stop_codon:yes gene_type:complete